MCHKKRYIERNRNIYKHFRKFGVKEYIKVIVRRETSAEETSQ